MRNFKNTPEEVEQRFKSGIVRFDDYSKYLGCQGYKNQLKKSISGGVITKSTYVNEVSKTEAIYFERDVTQDVLRFTLRGADFTRIDLLTTKNEKSKEQSQLLQQSVK
jgi:hypothetical protein